MSNVKTDHEKASRNIRLMRQRELELRRDAKDPAYDLDTLADMTGHSRDHIERLVRDAKVGQWVRGKIYVKTSKILEMAKEYGWVRLIPR